MWKNKGSLPAPGNEVVQSRPISLAVNEKFYNADLISQGVTPDLSDGDDRRIFGGPPESFDSGICLGVGNFDKYFLSDLI